MSKDGLDHAMRAAAEGPSGPDLYAQVVAVEASLARLDIAAGAYPDLQVSVAALDVGLAASELELASAAGEGAVALIALGAPPDDLEVAKDAVVGALAVLLRRIEQSLAGENVAIGRVTAQARALVHLRHAAAVLTPRP